MASLQQTMLSLQSKLPPSSFQIAKSLPIRRTNLPLRIGGGNAAGARMSATAAGSYAMALADVAKRNDTLELTSADVEKLEKVFSDPQVLNFFANPTVEVEKKRLVIDEIVKFSSLQSHTSNFLNILVDANRINIVTDIVKEFEMVYNKITDTQLAEVRSVVKLEPPQLAQIAKQVQKLTGRSGSVRVSQSGSSSGNLRTSQARSDSVTSNSQPLVSSSTQSSATSPATAANVLPTGNICPSGKIQLTGMTQSRSRSDVLGSGTGTYGHGSIMRGGGGSGVSPAKPVAPVTVGGSIRSSPAAMLGSDAEEVKRVGNEMYRKGLFGEALRLYDRAIALSPANAAYRSNRAAALTGLGRVGEAVKECEEALRLDPNYGRAHQRLASLLIRLGQADSARKHLCFLGKPSDPMELQKLEAVEKHMSKCADARRLGDWKAALMEVDAAIVSGADFSPQLVMCKVEALLKLHRLDAAHSKLLEVPKVEPFPASCSQSRFSGMACEAYTHFVKAQVEMALGRFENAVMAAEKASKLDPRSNEVAMLHNTVTLVARARVRGNDLYKSERYTEASSAYAEGLRLDPCNAILYCNRAACWFKLGMWERSIEDCNHALRFQPRYTKPLLRRAASNSKMERWAAAVSDYEALRKELPHDKEVAESLFHAQVALKKSRGEEVLNMEFGGEVEEVYSREQFKAAMNLPGVSVIHFSTASDHQCKQLSPFVDSLCTRYPSIHFLKVDIDKCQSIGNAENVRVVPTVKIYKNGTRVKEIVCPNKEVLEYSVRHYSS